MLSLILIRPLRCSWQAAVGAPAPPPRRTGRIPRCRSRCRPRASYCSSRWCSVAARTPPACSRSRSPSTAALPAGVGGDRLACCCRAPPDAAAAACGRERSSSDRSTRRNIDRSGDSRWWGASGARAGTSPRERAQPWEPAAVVARAMESSRHRNCCRPGSGRTALHSSRLDTRWPGGAGWQRAGDWGAPLRLERLWRSKLVAAAGAGWWV